MLSKRVVLAIALTWLAALETPHALADEALKIATDVWLPYENISNHGAPGFSTEVIRQVLHGMNVDSEILEFPWARAVKDVFEGKRDALYTAFRTEERAEYCHYPEEPLARDKWVFFVRSADIHQLSFSSYDEIQNRRIGVLRSASVTEEFWKFVREHGNYEEVETDQLNFKKLAKGRLDYVVTSYSNGVILAREMGLAGQIAPLESPVIKEDDLYIIFSKRTVTADFVQRFSDRLKAFKKTAAYRSIYARYFGPASR
jgi:polar amino acid transport system substrate-binding protein